MSLLVLTLPALVWGLALVWMAGWLVSAVRSRPRAARIPAGLALVQLAAAAGALVLTSVDQTGRAACMTGAVGMAANAGLFLIGVAALVLLLLFARPRLEAMGGTTILIAVILTSWLAALVHMRSALFCSL
ncbi:hypothetical protein [uncultured Roseobacter sp.]|uniref:hypothetical protein n=1 Tax=uncultured Roseobacter sp. TaxID=114847 RepID=UPI002607DB5B|nr:hypothetical protein [uncultured Roseobacter sp.]